MRDFARVASVWLLALLALLLFAMAAYTTWGWRGGMASVAALLERGVEAQATVEDIRRTPGRVEIDWRGQRHVTLPTYYLTYRYADGSGTTHLGVRQMYTSHMPYLRGDTFPVLFLPEQPNHSIALEDRKELGGQVPMIVIFATGGLLSALGAFLAHEPKRSRSGSGRAPVGDGAGVNFAPAIAHDLSEHSSGTSDYEAP